MLISTIEMFSVRHSLTRYRLHSQSGRIKARDEANFLSCLRKMGDPVLDLIVSVTESAMLHLRDILEKCPCLSSLVAYDIINADLVPALHPYPHRATFVLGVTAAGGAPTDSNAAAAPAKKQTVQEYLSLYDSPMAPLEKTCDYECYQAQYDNQYEDCFKKCIREEAASMKLPPPQF
ncbi:hypothetical protein K492DRAFT_200266 [Lichtheimia hyalospora FSU 10163]|nr:hypothetical protein K492DRAFT_200266 [Lichtheimia hyalospora FSU 10163]